MTLAVRDDPDTPLGNEWQASWFPWSYGDGAALFVDTGVQGETSPVAFFHNELGSEPVAASLG